MARVRARMLFLEIGLGVAVVAVLFRAAQLQIVRGKEFASQAAAQRREQVVLPARRGELLDRTGVPLAETQEFYHIGIAPDQVVDRRQLVQLASAALDVPAGVLARQLDSGKKYLYFHGPYTAVQIQPIRRLKGVHPESEYRRFYPSGDLARPIIGGFSADSGRGVGGLELALDSVLTGVPGEEEQLKDRAGRHYESPARRVRDPVPGQDVVLTIDAELQEIAQEGLSDAVDAMKALGGDVVFLDPRSGEVLALASIRRGADQGMEAAPTTITEPFQPGSTAKLFTAAALLSHDLVKPTDQVYAENGSYTFDVPGGKQRTIRDAHVEKGSLTLAKAIQVSSNIAMAKFSTRLTPETHYEALRDFGFGSPTGVEFPQEARGILNRPDGWRVGFSQPSLAMGYEFTVTPLQLAAAYGAVANDGILLTPTLVREIRDPSGTVLYQHRPEPVRRVISPEVTAKLKEFLQGAVGEGGTGDKAQLVNYTLMGKTGTAQRVQNGRYVEGSYTASFASLFPAADPRLVVVVKIDDPKGQYYGGLTAAPVTRRMLDQALAARTIAIDRSRFASRAAPDSSPAAPVAEPDANPRVVLAWPAGVAPTPPRLRLPVPSTIGNSARRAVLALHRRGFEVDLRGNGKVIRTQPAPGDSATTGASVTVWTE